MSATNSTTNYGLPQWIATDKPTFLGDLNSAFSAIDTAIKAIATAISDNDISTLSTSVSNLQSSVSDLRTITGDITNQLVNIVEDIDGNATNIETMNETIGSGTLETTSKNLIGATNEVRQLASTAKTTAETARDKFTDLTGTLTANSTTCIINSSAIKTDSIIDIYTDVFGLSPENVEVISGKITITFKAQSNDVSVKVRLS